MLLGALVTWQVILRLGAQRTPAPPLDPVEPTSNLAKTSDLLRAEEPELEPWLKKVRAELEAYDG